MKKIISISIFILSLYLSLFAKSIWVDKNIYSAGSQINSGDFINVKVLDISNLSFELKLSDKTSFNVVSNPDVNITGFLPKISADKNVVNNKNVKLKNKGKLKIEITSQVGRAIGRGRYRLTGNRTYNINGKITIVKISGIVDSQFVKNGSINSNKIGNFRIDINTSSAVANIKRPALKKDEKANINLTEQEKQKIITEYLKKILSDLSR